LVNRDSVHSIERREQNRFHSCVQRETVAVSKCLPHLTGVLCELFHERFCRHEAGGVVPGREAVAPAVVVTKKRLLSLPHNVGNELIRASVPRLGRVRRSSWSAAELAVVKRHEESRLAVIRFLGIRPMVSRKRFSRAAIQANPQHCVRRYTVYLRAVHTCVSLWRSKQAGWPSTQQDSAHRDRGLSNASPCLYGTSSAWSASFERPHDASLARRAFAESECAGAVGRCTAI
jgi:hypothetical protein